jgi:hypothetical protein
MTATFPSPNASSTTEALARAANPELRRLEVCETESTVELTGVVSCFYLKQMANETVRVAAAGRRIINRVFVLREGLTANDSFC